MFEPYMSLSCRLLELKTYVVAFVYQTQSVYRKPFKNT